MFGRKKSIFKIFYHFILILHQIYNFYPISKKFFWKKTLLSYVFKPDEFNRILWEKCPYWVDKNCKLTISSNRAIGEWNKDAAR